MYIYVPVSLLAFKLIDFSILVLIYVDKMV